MLRKNLPLHHLKKSDFVNDKEVDRCLEVGLCFNNLDENTIGFIVKLISVSSTRQGSKEIYIIALLKAS